MVVVSRNLLQYIPKSGSILICGGVGSGKSVLAYGIAEQLHLYQPKRQVFVYNFPGDPGILPTWVTPTNEEEFPEGSIVISDEAYFSFYSKDHANELNKFMDKFTGLVRQKGILVLFVTQTLRKLTLATVSGVQVLLVKRPDPMAVKLDRAQLRKLLEEALHAFRGLKEKDRLTATYVYALNFEGLIEDSNKPPSFWSEKVSKAWQGVRLERGKAEIRGVWEEALTKPVSKVKTCLQCKRFAYMPGGVCEFCGTKLE